MNATDVVIPAHDKDSATLGLAVGSVLRHVTPVRRVCVVSRRRFESPDLRVEWVPEPDEGQLPSVDQIHARWSARAPEFAWRAPWIYQQLLKLGAGSFIDDLSPSYLVLDADVMFLRAVSLRAPDGVRFPYSRASENTQPYRDAFERLFGRRAATSHSMIAHHMLYDRALLGEMLDEIERRHAKPWHDAYIDAIDPRVASPISELDTYGWWVLDRHPELARQRQLYWRDVRVIPSALARVQLARRVDFVAAHAWMRKSRPQCVLDAWVTVAYGLYRALVGRGATNADTTNADA